MKNFATVAAAVALGLGVVGTAHAYVFSFGEDINGSSSVSLRDRPFSTEAARSFLASLTTSQVANFEDSAPGAPAPLALSFVSSTATPLKATLNGDSGKVAVNGLLTNSGRYSVPGGSKYWEATTGSFSIDFNTSIAAFGFYGIDLGDFDGKVFLDFVSENGQTILSKTLETTAGSQDPQNQPTDGAVLFFGLRAESSAELFKRVVFRNEGRNGDIFAFDNFTIGDRCQTSLTTLCTITAPPTAGIPEPGTLALAGLALMGLVTARRRKF